MVAICVLIWLPDSPATASFLTPREKLVAIERVRDNQVRPRCPFYLPPLTLIT